MKTRKTKTKQKPTQPTTMKKKPKQKLNQNRKKKKEMQNNTTGVLRNFPSIHRNHMRQQYPLIQKHKQKLSI